MARELKDRHGQVVKVGDTVIFPHDAGYEFWRGEITAITPDAKWADVLVNQGILVRVSLRQLVLFHW